MVCGWLLFACLLRIGVASADDWPQWRGAQRDGRWRETGIVERFTDAQLPTKWRVPIGSGYSSPTVADGRVYVTDRLTKPTEQERIHCFAAADGRSLWTVSYGCDYGKIGYKAGPRASVTIDDGLAYALGAAGHLHCLDAAEGRIVWKRDLNAEYRIEMPIWGIAAAPLVVDGLLILQIGGADGACVVALDKKTGQEKWRALSERGQYSSPIVVVQGGRRVVVCWTGDSVAGIAPEDGKVYWRYPWKPKNMPIGVATPVVSGERLFLTSFYDGSLMLRLSASEPKVEKIWQRVGASERETDALHSIISTPLLLGDHVYGVDSYGELRCLDARTGDRVWEDLSAVPKIRWGTIHFVEQGERVWMFNERGELIIARLSPRGYEPLSRAQLIAPTTDQLPRRDGVCWSHPAFADRHVFIRNDQELVCASLGIPANPR